MLIFCFFEGARKLAACQKAFDAVPLDSIESILILWQNKVSSSSMLLLLLQHVNVNHLALLFLLLNDLLCIVVTYLA